MPSSVTVIGVGNMGSALARAFIGAGHEVTVWNRTPEKCRPLAELGARVAPDEAAAVAASSVVVVCLAQYEQVRNALQQAADRGVLEGRTVVNLTWGAAPAAHKMAAWCAQRGAPYLDGMIDNYPSDIGTPTGIIIIGGDEQVWSAHESLLSVLGNVIYAGENYSAPNVLANATGIVFYHVALAAFYEAAAYARYYGVEPGAMQSTMDAMLELLRANFKRGIDHLESGSFETDQASIKIHWEACVMVRDELREIGQQGRLTAATVDLLDPGMTDAKQFLAISAIVDELTDGR